MLWFQHNIYQYYLVIIISLYTDNIAVPCSLHVLSYSFFLSLEFEICCKIFGSYNVLPTIAPCSEISNVEHYAINVILINKILEFILLVIHYFIGDWKYILCEYPLRFNKTLRNWYVIMAVIPQIRYGSVL